jgi:hypothetical protein
LPASERHPLVVTWLFFLQPVALGAKLIDLSEHPVEQRLEAEDIPECCVASRQSFNR